MSYARILFAMAIGALLGACKPPHDERPPVSYGEVMAGVARRFEILGRALVAGRFELASYQLDEVSEAFEQTLPHASLPREGHPEVLPGRAKAFRDTLALGELQQALSRRDAALSKALFGRIAAACNECHVASGHGFIEVPLSPMQSIPRTD